MHLARTPSIHRPIALLSASVKQTRVLLNDMRILSSNFHVHGIRSLRRFVPCRCKDMHLSLSLLHVFHKVI
jgi:hypothetical protein